MSLKTLLLEVSRHRLPLSDRKKGIRRMLLTWSCDKIANPELRNRRLEWFDRRKIGGREFREAYEKELLHEIHSGLVRAMEPDAAGN